MVYLSGPIHSRNKDGSYNLGDWWTQRSNINSAGFVAAHLWKNGISVICPHKNSEGFDGLLKDEEILKGNLRLIEACDAIIMLPGWRNSQKATIEKEFAQHKNIKVINVEDEEVFTRHHTVGQLAASIKKILENRD